MPIRDAQNSHRWSLLFKPVLCSSFAIAAGAERLECTGISVFSVRSVGSSSTWKSVMYLPLNYVLPEVQPLHTEGDTL